MKILITVFEKYSSQYETVLESDYPYFSSGLKFLQPLPGTQNIASVQFFGKVEPPILVANSIAEEIVSIVSKENIGNMQVELYFLHRILFFIVISIIVSNFDLIND